MSFATQALATFRRRGQGTVPEAGLPALFVMEPTMSITAAVTASWHPVWSLQTPGATERAGLAAGRASIDDAIHRFDLRTVVFCAEATVPPDRSAARERLLGACVAAKEDPALRSHAVAVEALWFDTTEGDIFRWDAKTRRFELLSDDGLECFWAEIHKRAGSAPSEALGVA